MSRVSQIRIKPWLAFSFITLLLLLVGIGQSWSAALGILNLCLISAIMALGVNIQWGYAGLLNVGIMGFAALGGLSAVLVSHAPVTMAWEASSTKLLLALIVAVTTIAVALLIHKKLGRGRHRRIAIGIILLLGWFATRYFFDPAVALIEATNPSKTGFLGGIGMPILLSWIVGGLVVAAAAWFIGKVALGLRADYLAIATLGIAEIIIAILKNEDWLTRGVKNVTELPRPVPYEINLQTSQWFIDIVARWHEWQPFALSNTNQNTSLQQLVIEASSIAVKLCYAGLFTVVLAVILILSTKALHSPWGRMMRAIRDNEVAAAAMGKDVTGRQLQIFILGSAIVGIAGAMLTTLDGQFTPASYHPLRFTFLIWVMVIVGGSGNNLGSVLGGFLIWLAWIESEPVGIWLIQFGTTWMDDANWLKIHFISNAHHMRLLLMGFILLLVLRFRPAGILPEVIPGARSGN